MSFPFDEYEFRVLTVEHNHSPDRPRIRAFLEPRGYQFAAAIDIDDCYVRGAKRGRAWRSHAFRR